MTVSLNKGGNVSLSKVDPSLKKLCIGLGWDARASDGADFDLDAVLFMLNSTGKVRQDLDFIFYNNLVSPCGSVTHTGDNRTGDGDGDDEQILIDLTKVPSDVTKLVVAVTIHEAQQRNQNFGQVSNAYIRLVNSESSVELARYDLSEDASLHTAIVFGEVYLHNNEWKFRAVGQGFNDGLGPLARTYGVNI